MRDNERDLLGAAAQASEQIGIFEADGWRRGGLKAQSNDIQQHEHRRHEQDVEEQELRPGKTEGERHLLLRQVSPSARCKIFAASASASTNAASCGSPDMPPSCAARM